MLGGECTCIMYPVGPFCAPAFSSRGGVKFRNSVRWPILASAVGSEIERPWKVGLREIVGGPRSVSVSLPELCFSST